VYSSPAFFIQALAGLRKSSGITRGQLLNPCYNLELIKEDSPMTAVAETIKVLIQDKSTMKFLATGDDWTEQKAQARNFVNYLIALRFVSHYPEKQLQVIADPAI
jgi:hypothetical protein